jgi:hypothetical protein
VAGPPTEEIVEVDDQAAWGTGLEHAHDLVGEWLPVAGQALIDLRGLKPAVGERRIQQLGVEQVGDDDVERRARQWGRRVASGWVTSGERGGDNHVGGAARDIELPCDDELAAAQSALRALKGLTIEIEQPQLAGTAGEAAQGEIVSVARPDDRDPRAVLDVAVK